MHHRVLSAGLLASGLLLAGCGTPPSANTSDSKESEAYAKYEGLTGEERTEMLLAAAKKEGGVLDLYTSNTDIQELVDGFEKAYPGIKVNAFRANSETVLQRILQEHGARKTRNDVVDTNDIELRAMNDEQLLHEYEGPALEGLKPEATKPEGWTAERFNAFVVGWNTKLVPKGKEPKNFADFAGPEWKGKLSVELGDWDWYMSMSTYLTEEKGMSQQEVDALFTKIAKNARLAKGHTVQGEMLGAGQFSVAMSVYSHTIDKAAEKGAPVAWRPPVEPVIMRPNGLALMKEPRHPAAALLWTDWVLTEGQKVIADSKRIPAAKEVPGFKDPIPADTEVYSLDKSDASDNQKWNAAYDALLRGVPKAG
ncbi:ABC transporter substrate-binding protein [Streptomyces sp. NPDC059909]|uniref:ABC transporter substrate-binding protein n=1 Tax=Streptomyces sp. NPDC059909 TaxID=3346998 RepID=UPI00365E150C